MKPLLVLLVTSVLALVVLYVGTSEWNIALAGRIGMAFMLAFTGSGHFAFTKGMAMMLPAFVPYKQMVVYVTGGLELLAAAGLLIPATQVVTGWLVIAFFVVIAPANVKAALDHVDYQKGTFNGPGPAYLWFRLPVQALYIIWVYVMAIDPNL